MSNFYAQRTPENVCIAISQLSEPVEHPALIPIEFYDESLLGKIWNGVSFDEPPEVPPEPVELGSKITKLAMRNRFTFAERVAIEAAADSDPEVKVIIKDFDSASFIDLERQDTISAVTLYDVKGLISSARANEILTAPVTEIEVPE